MEFLGRSRIRGEKRRVDGREEQKPKMVDVKENRRQEGVQQSQGWWEVWEKREATNIQILISWEPTLKNWFHQILQPESVTTRLHSSSAISLVWFYLLLAWLLLTTLPSFYDQLLNISW